VSSDQTQSGNGKTKNERRIRVENPEASQRRGSIMKRILAAAVCLGLAVPLFAQSKQDERLTASYQVLKEILGTPDKGIPRDLLDKSECVIIYPSVKKAAFIVGASYGRGVITCRTGANLNGPWSAPAIFALEGGSFGLQAGGTGNRFCASGHERSGGTVRAQEQG
jgi:hypothetical protein